MTRPTTIPHDELAEIALTAAPGSEPKHQPRSYTCGCPRCELERSQAAQLARLRPRPADDFAGQLSGDVTLTSGRYRR